MYVQKGFQKYTLYRYKFNIFVLKIKCFCKTVFLIEI